MSTTDAAEAQATTMDPPTRSRDMLSGADNDSESGIPMLTSTCRNLLIDIPAIPVVLAAIAMGMMRVPVSVGRACASRTARNHGVAVIGSTRSISTSTRRIYGPHSATTTLSSTPTPT